MFIKTNLKSGFWQVPMDPTSVPKAVFITPDRLYKWCRCSFGVMNGPLHFQRYTNIILMNAGLHSDAGFFIDGLDSGSFDYTSAADRLDCLLEACINSKIKVVAEKIDLGYTKIPFLGFLIKQRSLQTNPTIIQAIQ